MHDSLRRIAVTTAALLLAVAGLYVFRARTGGYSVFDFLQGKGMPPPPRPEPFTPPNQNPVDLASVQILAQLDLEYRRFAQAVMPAVVSLDTKREVSVPKMTSAAVIYLARTDAYNGGRDGAAKVDARHRRSRQAVQVETQLYRQGRESVEVRSEVPQIRRTPRSATHALCSPDRALQFAKANLALPDRSPFDGIRQEKGGSTAYIFKIDAPKLIADARADLDGALLQLFCLGLICGLRKREADTLLWRQVDLDSGRIRIEATEYFRPKTTDSAGAVDLDENLRALMRGWKARARGQFVVEGRQEMPKGTGYRCEAKHKALIAWLRSRVSPPGSPSTNCAKS
ncbi:MAG: hypothetical protein R3F11_08990 [Verrucomicrobiales bacterium]